MSGEYGFHDIVLISGLHLTPAYLYRTVIYQERTPPRHRMSLSSAESFPTGPEMELFLLRLWKVAAYRSSVENIQGIPLCGAVLGSTFKFQQVKHIYLPWPVIGLTEGRQLLNCFPQLQSVTLTQYHWQSLEGERPSREIGIDGVREVKLDMLGFGPEISYL